jgi:hypothetical protein
VRLVALSTAERAELALANEVADGIVRLLNVVPDRVDGRAARRPELPDKITLHAGLPATQTRLFLPELLGPVDSLRVTAASPLEVIRQSFLHEREDTLDWHEVFDRLWAPVQRALDGGSDEDPEMVPLPGATPVQGTEAESAAPRQMTA